jgi:hypothetical protein
MADKLNGTAIATTSIPANRIIDYSLTADRFVSDIATVLNDTARPKISNLTYFGANTTANVNGGQTIVLTGSNFQANVQIYLNAFNNTYLFSNTIAASSVTRANANSVSFTTPARTAGTYHVYLINTDDGGYAVFARPGIVYA